MQLRLLLLLACSLAACQGFTPVRYAPSPTSHQSRQQHKPSFQGYSPSSLDWSLFQHPYSQDEENLKKYPLMQRISSLLGRLDTIDSAQLPQETRVSGLFRRIRQIHNPISYLILSLMAGLRWDWCFRNPYYWFGVAFCVKWYRAKYVFKIPVWDRQPNWNNIITSPEQEKDLKAFTCKKCGSTLFIAKTREFFFEGSTGIGGLGCFSCGAKGKENFVMDRDRIVDDVKDMDDYFEYERPLDFVSRAERRELLKAAEGDESKANQMLIDKQLQQPPSPTAPQSNNGEATKAEKQQSQESSKGEQPNSAPRPDPPRKKPSSSKPPSIGDDDLDALDMDSL